MATYAIDESQRKAARLAGFTFLFAMAIVILANYGINIRLIVPGNAAETARNITAHETLFRINIACNLIYIVSLVVLLAALYVILQPVNRNLALVAALCRLLELPRPSRRTWARCGVLLRSTRLAPFGTWVTLLTCQSSS